MSIKDWTFTKNSRLWRWAAVLLLIVLDVSTVAADNYTDLASGFYYLENNQGGSNGYYLVPAKGENSGNLKYYQGDFNTPYLTTYQKSKESDQSNFIWYIEKVDDDGHYRFIHVLTGKYIVMNDIVISNMRGRLRLHLETLATPPGDNAQFVLDASGNTIGIRHETECGYQDNNNTEAWWWDISDGNKDSYSQSDYKGLLGLWCTKTDNARFKWNTPVEASEEVCLPPRIVYDESTRQVTIESPVGELGVTYYYTDDDTEPTADEAHKYTVPFILAEGKNKVKAIAVKGNFKNPTTRVFNTEQCATPVITNNDGVLTMTTTTVGASIYYTIDDTKPTLKSIKYDPDNKPNLGRDTDVSYVKAIAAKADDGSDVSDVCTLEIPQCAQPTITNQSGTITITNKEDGSTVRYTTNNADPKSNTGTAITETSKQLTYTIEEAIPTFKARAFKDGYRRSDLVTLSPTTVATPVLANNYDGSVSITTTTAGATIYYTTSETSTLPANPTTASTQYTAGCITLPEETTLVTIKAKAFKPGNTPSAVLTYTVLQCDAPSIVYVDGTATITSALSDDHIHYRLSASDAWTDYTSPLTLGDDGYVQAYVSHAGQRSSTIAELTKPAEIHSANDIPQTTEGLSGSYLLAADFTWDASLGTDDAPFTGTLDGQFNTYNNISTPLVNYANGAVIKNITLKNVSVSGTDVGAICNVADGATKIYNCGVLSGSVSGTGAVGGLVGLIQEGSTARVVNCYNYATVRGGTHAAGIVGRNDGTVDKTTNDHVRIAMCVMYGDIESDGVVAPVYVGSINADADRGVKANTHQSNEKQFTEYNYYRYAANLNYTPGFFNEQQAIAKDIWLTRFPFYRHILNTHRELAAYFLFSDHTAAHVAEIGHWVQQQGDDAPPFPVIERWQKNTQKVVGRDVSSLATTTTAERDYAGKVLTDRGTNGRLKVNLNISGQSYVAELPITDMDTLRYDFTYGKVVLPYVSEYTGWTRDYKKICTGWKITEVKGTETFKTFNIPNDEPYNFADRNNPQKDIYDATENPYVFAQGGNYIVPYGVTEISIEANFANAFYLSDPAYDRGYAAAYNGGVNLGGNVDDNYHGQKVYTSLGTLVAALDNQTNPHVNAIVLVGNFHYNWADIGGKVLNDAKGVTVMSVDEDNNQEPDYGWYSYHNTVRQSVPALRFDFVPDIGIGMAQRVKNSAAVPTVNIYNSKAWFELTETSLVLMNECETEDGNFAAADNGKGNNRWIANNGYFLEYVRGFAKKADRLSYVQIGGNAYVEKFYPGGPHFGKNFESVLRPVIVTGGEIEECFMTGKGVNNNVQAEGTNVYFWGAGGKIHKWLGAYMVKFKNNADIKAKIDHAYIYRFFGGGTSSVAPVRGNIDVTIDNSLVDFYCGGPEFGNMDNGKTVTTHATGTTFRHYYGAGFGGTSITLENKLDDSKIDFTKDYTYGNYVSQYYVNDDKSKRLSYDANKGGFSTCYELELIPYAGGTGSGVARYYAGRASFSTATSGTVTNQLVHCIIEDDFYGAGCQGKVSGKVTSTLTDCTLRGSAFGGGYKAANNTLMVYPTDDPILSKYTKETAVLTEFNYDNLVKEEWSWSEGKAGEKDDTKHIFYTSEKLTELGNVTDSITITLNGATTVAGNVYGGGNESRSVKTTKVNIEGTVQVQGSVYGGANVADVGQGTEVNLKGGTVENDVYGGGRGRLAAEGVTAVAATVGDATVNLNPEVGDDAKGCVVKGRIFGCNNLNGTPLGDVKVHVYATQRDGATRITNTDDYTEAKKKGRKDEDDNYILDSFDVKAVYGGGNLAAYEPYQDKVTDSDDVKTQNVAKRAAAKACVIIDGCDRTSIGQVYGGGNAASTPGTQVDINGTYEIAEVFGGGNGKDRVSYDGGVHYVDNPGANVGYRAYDDNADDAQTADDRTENYAYGSGRAQVNINGGEIHYVYGGSNTKGNVRHIAVAMLEEAQQDGEAVCPFVVNAAYGGGKSATMDGEARLEMKCIPGMTSAFGGAENADIENNVSLNITNGTFQQVFGGNNKGGRIKGGIVVNIEETGCRPVVIGELYGGGNQAAYSIYGYKQVTEGTGDDAVTTWQPRESAEDKGSGPATPYANPTVNVKSCTAIGDVYGGGYGESAVMVANPVVNINQVYGKDYVSEPKTTANYTATATTLGTIGNVYGGGNAAKVIGNTNVNIGTAEKISFVTSDYGAAEGTPPATDVKVVGANITGNVYGGGNAADVTGNTNVTIGTAP